MIVDQLLEFLKVFVSVLARTNPQERRNRAFAKTLLKLHYDLLTLVDNWRSILKVLGKLDKFKSTNDLDELEGVDLVLFESLLLEQFALITRIQATLENTNVGQVLAIHLPELKPIVAGVFDSKLKRLHVIILSAEQQGLLPGWWFVGAAGLLEPVVQLVGIGRDFPPVRAKDAERAWRQMSLPDAKAIKRSLYSLGKVSPMIDMLRQFILDNYELDEVI